MSVAAAYLWENGMVMVFDEDGHQVPELQDEVSPELVKRIRQASTADTKWVGFGEDGRAVWPR